MFRILARECGRRFFFVRAFIIVEFGSIAVARFAGWLINLLSYLGLRAVALHPRLYSVARIRGLGFDTRISRESLGKDKGLKPTAKFNAPLRGGERRANG